MKIEKETCVISLVSEIIYNPEYQEIILIGKAAIQFLLNEIKHQRGQWFWALKQISDEDPVAPEDRGNIKKMRESWIKWGKDKGYIVGG